MKLEELQTLVIEWAENKGLLTDVTPERIEKQTLKVLEEIGETAGAYIKGDAPQLIDGIGDVAVTLIIVGAMKGHPIGFTNYERKIQHPLLSTNECLIFYSQDDDAEYLNHAYTHLSIFATSQGLDFGECLESAYNVIAKRTGKMVNGTFIKD